MYLNTTLLLKKWSDNSLPLAWAINLPLSGYSCKYSLSLLKRGCRSGSLREIGSPLTGLRFYVTRILSFCYYFYFSSSNSFLFIFFGSSCFGMYLLGLLANAIVETSDFCRHATTKIRVFIYTEVTDVLLINFELCDNKDSVILLTLMLLLILYLVVFLYL